MSFDPEETEEGEFRGNNRQLLYRGRRRSHRFTLLDGKRFEYDLILNREPDSNVVSLALTFPGELDFFRQPDSHSQELTGSYAVYSRESNGIFGTGKLCHIYRPKIIDSRGRSVWGDLRIDGKCLSIIIPEEWLADAAYPVVVDPIIGTQTEGSTCLRDYAPFFFEIRIPVNRFYTSDRCIGPCTAHYFTHSYDEIPCGGYPVIYADASEKPTTKLSSEEPFINMNGIPILSPSWCSAEFNIAIDIPVNSYLWFGIHPRNYYLPWFDWGMKCYAEDPDYDWDPVFPVPTYGNITTSSENYYMKISMYFDYVAENQYYSYPKETVSISSTSNRIGTYKRKWYDYVRPPSTLTNRSNRVRSIFDTQKATTWIRKSIKFQRVVETLEDVIDQGLIAGFFLYRAATGLVFVTDKALRRLSISVFVVSLSFVRDFLLPHFVRSREEIILYSRITREIEIKSRV